MIIKNTFVQISILQQQGSFAEWMTYEKALVTIQTMSNNDGNSSNYGVNDS